MTSKPEPAKAIGQRRADYNRVFLDELRQRVNDNTDSPCIQGGVLRDPESSNLTETELLGISFSMMAVRYFTGCCSEQAADILLRDLKQTHPQLAGLCYSFHNGLIFKRLLLMLLMSRAH
jgi:hypothetical protein